MSFSRYPSYKEVNRSDLDSVPSSWEIRSLKHVAKFRNSNVDKLSDENEEAVELCNYTDVYYNEKIHGGIDFMRATATAKEVEQFSLRQGDVLITKDSEDRDDIGVPAIVCESMHKVVCGYHLTLIRPSQKLRAEFLFRFLQSDFARYQFKVRASGVTRYSLGQDAIGGLVVPVPSDREQRTIVNFLSHETTRIDRLIEKQRRLIELLDEKRQAVISHAVTKGMNPDVAMMRCDLSWLDSIPEDWKTPRLKMLVAAIGGSTPSKKKKEYWSGDIPWVSPKDMKCDEVSETQDYISMAAMQENRLVKVPVGSVLIVVRGMILAHSLPIAINSIEITINQDMKALVPKNEISAKYLVYMLKGIRNIIFECVDSSAHGTKKLDWDDFCRLQVPLPPRSEQDRIVVKLDREIDLINRLIYKAKQMTVILKERRAGLISGAVTGKIDVRNWKPPQSANEAEERDHELLEAAEEQAGYG